MAQRGDTVPLSPSTAGVAAKMSRAITGTHWRVNHSRMVGRKSARQGSAPNKLMLFGHVGGAAQAER